MKILLVLVFYIEFAYVLCQEKHVVILKNEMNDVMTEHVTAAAQTYVLYEKNMTIIAEGLATSMNKKFGNNWNCLTSESSCLTGIKLDHLKEYFIWFSIENHNFILYRNDMQKNDEEFKSIIDKAKHSNISNIYTQLNDTINGDIRKIINGSFYQNLDSCGNSDVIAYCYHAIAQYIATEVHYKYSESKWVVSAHIAKHGIADASFAFQTSIFRIGNLDIEIWKFD